MSFSAMPLVAQFSTLESLGLILINRSPIRWVDVRRGQSMSGTDSGSTNPYYVLYYGIPDTRPLPRLHIYSNFVKTKPIFGKIVGVRWKGGKEMHGIEKSLESQKEISNHILKSRREISIRTSPEGSCWLLENFNRSHAPTKEEWHCWEIVANRLLKTPVNIHN